MAKANTIVSSSEVLYKKVLVAQSAVEMVVDVQGDHVGNWAFVFSELLGELVKLADEHHSACRRVGPMLSYLQTGVVPGALDHSP